MAFALNHIVQAYGANVRAARTAYAQILVHGDVRPVDAQARRQSIRTAHCMAVVLADGF